MSRGAVFLDRDGVINEGVPDPSSGQLESPLTVADVRLLPGVPAALRRLAGAGWALACVTNQPAAAKGKAPVEQLRAVHEHVLALLRREGVVLGVSRICWHHPEGAVPALTMRCDCRKPAPGMLLSAAAELGADVAASWMIGDTDADVQAGRTAGARTVLIEYPGSAHKRTGGQAPTFWAEDLTGAVNNLLGWPPMVNRSSAPGASA